MPDNISKRFKVSGENCNMLFPQIKLNYPDYFVLLNSFFFYFLINLHAVLNKQLLIYWHVHELSCKFKKKLVLIIICLIA